MPYLSLSFLLFSFHLFLSWLLFLSFGCLLLEFLFDYSTHHSVCERWLIGNRPTPWRLVRVVGAKRSLPGDISCAISGIVVIAWWGILVSRICLLLLADRADNFGRLTSTVEWVSSYDLARLVIASQHDVDIALVQIIYCIRLLVESSLAKTVYFR